jgi:hypothetical protein
MLFPTIGLVVAFFAAIAVIALIGGSGGSIAPGGPAWCC